MKKPAGSLRILGVDTALRTTGYGVIDYDGRQFSVVDCGIIKTSPKAPLSECLRRLQGGIQDLAEAFAPDQASLESAFYCKNVRTAMVLGSARGVVIATLAARAIPIYEYAPTKAKQAVTGWGQASKEQVAAIVAKLTGISTASILLDSTDALALAICHAQAVSSPHAILQPKPV